MDASEIITNMIPRKLCNVMLRKISWTDSVKNEDVVLNQKGKERPTYNTTKVTHSFHKKN
jgi:hypothetical protein